MRKEFPLCYETHGDSANPCILLISGIGGQLINWSSSFIQSLVAGGFYVVAFDNRDAGLSKQYDEFGTPSLEDLMQGKLPEKFYTIDDMAADAILLLDELYKAKAHVVGISMGGMIAQLIAIHYPERVASLICIASSSGEKDLPASTKEVQEFFFARKREKASTKEDYVQEKTALYKVYNHPDYFDAKSVKKLHERIYDRNHEASGFMRQLIALAVASPRTQMLNKLDVPTLIIHGDYDPVFPIEHGRQLAESIKGSKLIELEKFGHGIPEYFCEVITNHMKNFYSR